MPGGQRARRRRFARLARRRLCRRGAADPLLLQFGRRPDDDLDEGIGIEMLAGRVAHVVEGDGAAVMAGDTLTVNYCGIGLQSRQMFDSSWTRGEPISFPLDGLIQGWIQGLPGMKVGGQRLLVIPGDLGYGPQGQGTILPNETLVFVVQLVSIP